MNVGSLDGRSKLPEIRHKHRWLHSQGEKESHVEPPSGLRWGTAAVGRHPLEQAPVVLLEGHGGEDGELRRGRRGAAWERPGPVAGPRRQRPCGRGQAV